MAGTKKQIFVIRKIMSMENTIILAIMLKISCKCSSTAKKYEFRVGCPVSEPRKDFREVHLRKLQYGVANVTENKLSFIKYHVTVTPKMSPATDVQTNEFKNPVRGAAHQQNL